MPKDLSWVAVINSAMARIIWRDQDPVGKVYLTGGSLPVEVVGVVADVKARGIRRDSVPQAYYPLTAALSRTRIGSQLAVKTSTAPLSALGTVRKELNALDNSLAVLRPRTMNDVISDSMQDTSLQALLLSAFAALALILAAVGLYSVMSYLVTQRTQEIGIRMALGARRSDVLRLVMGHGARLTLAGVVVGVSAALALNRLIRSLLFGVGANDLLTFAVVVALAACYIPAWRATRVDPLIALRYE